MRTLAGLPLDDSSLARTLYARDASIYRIPPLGVVKPSTVDEVRAVVAAAREEGLPITARGAGTSCAGNAVGPGVVLDLRALNELTIDAEAQTATVQPGVVLADLNRAAAQVGLRFGPDPSTATRCTMGGMIGNNACGPRALGYGRTSDNLLAAELVDPWPVDALAALGTRHADVIRRECGTFSRQVSGYSLEHLLPERLDPIKLLAGSEGTLGVLTSATVRLARLPERTCMIALGYPSMAEAADAVPSLLRFGPLACEGLDDRIVEVARQKGPVPDLPRGSGYLILELGGGSDAEVLARAQELVSAAGALDARVVQGDPAAALWKVRADGAGLAAVALEKPAYAGWEDAAVPPARLGAYLRRFEELLSEHGLHALPYGHFGEGCVHARIDFPLDEPARLRRFLFDAAEVVASLGGSMSGEHGDGRARGELLPLMYAPAVMDVFGEVRRLCDPSGLLNPGIITAPDPVEGALWQPSPSSVVSGADRCTGVGACLSHQPGASMCPSHRATGREIDSTRGRARVLQDWNAKRQCEFAPTCEQKVTLSSAQPTAEPVHVTHLPTDDDVLAALDHCVACKSCARECPTSVDIASLKSIALEDIYARRRRPRSHLFLGRLPIWLGLLQRIPGAIGLVNAANRTPLRRVTSLVVGMDNRRSLPRLKKWAAHSLSLPKGPVAEPLEATSRPVALWPDSFSRSVDPSAVAAMAIVLRDAGFDPFLVDESVCCGLTWITTGQRETARRKLRASLDVLAPLAEAGIPIVGMEPSCTAVWRSDAAELLPEDPRVADVAGHVKTLAEVLTDAAWAPPSLAGHTVVVQPHCHHRAVLGWAPDQALLEATGATIVTVDGCCGLAGNYGMEEGHYEVSTAIAELNLLPALREHPDAIYLADGFSCRTQATDLAGRDGMTLAQLFAAHLESTGE